jgi:hypothetical protein
MHLKTKVPDRLGRSIYDVPFYASLITSIHPCVMKERDWVNPVSEVCLRVEWESFPFSKHRQNIQKWFITWLFVALKKNITRHIIYKSIRNNERRIRTREFQI